MYITTLFVFFGRCKDGIAYPDNYASYAVSVRQYRILQSRFLQCILYSKPPCGLLILSGHTPTYKGLSPSGKSHTCIWLSENDLYFWTFSTAYNKWALHDAHAGRTPTPPFFGKGGSGVGSFWAGGLGHLARATAL
ncbi:MAG: hypothetical protein WCP32_17985 [Bacteroidota bacterium]